MKLLALVCAALGVAAALGDHKSLREVAQDSQAQHSAETDAAQGSLVEAHAGKALADKAVQSDVGHGLPLLRSAAHDVAGLASAVAAAPDDLCSGDNHNCLYFEYDATAGDVSIINITGWCNPYDKPVIQFGNNFIGFVGQPGPNHDVCSNWNQYWPDPYQHHSSRLSMMPNVPWSVCAAVSPWFFCVLDITFVLGADPGHGVPGRLTKQSLRVAKSHSSWALGGDTCDHFSLTDNMVCGDNVSTDKVIISRLFPGSLLPNKVKMRQY
jgi:hypothetical protein